jgi:prepilin-type N-terminal cleavage/methylation domain-containing protein
MIMNMKMTKKLGKWEKMSLSDKYNNRGMTLVEIIVAIAILGIISITVITAIGSYYKLTVRGKSITQDVFLVQENMENSIYEVKEKLREGQAVTWPSHNYSLFSGQPYAVSVTGYTLNESVDNRDLTTIVSSSVSPELPVPVIGTVTISKSDSSKNYAAYTALNLTGNVTYSSSTDLFFTQYQWYKSRDGYNMPVYSTPEEIEVGIRYPRFPDDYEPISGATSATLSNLTDYGGHHIIFAATPIAHSMKMGITKYSEPLFLYGPPVISNLKYHLDASVINKTDTNQVRHDSATDIYYIKQWPNLVKYLDSTAIADASQTTEAIQPQLNEYSFNGTDIPEVWGQTASSSVSGSNVNVSSYASWSTDPDNITFFIVVKMDSSLLNQTIMQGTNWQLGVNAAGEVYLSKAGNVINAVASEGIDDKLHVISGKMTGSEVSFKIDKGYEYSVSAGSDPSTRSLSLFATNFEIAELLIYHSDMADTDIEKNIEYLLSKFDPNIIPWTISSLHNMTDTAAQGATYVMPQKALATMTNSATRYVDVTWNGTINTDTVGSQTITGYAVVDPTKTVTLTVDVIGIVGVKNIEEDVRYRIPYTAPVMAEAEYSDGSTQAVPVTWTGSINTFVEGTQVITGNMTNSPYLEVTLTVHVLRKPVTAITLDKSNLSMFVDAEEDLTAEVVPSDADYQDVTWSSDDETVAMVDQNGHVTAIALGIANIIVTSADDPTVSATCSVNVIAPPPVYLNSIEIQQQRWPSWRNIDLNPAFSQLIVNYSSNMSDNWRYSDDIRIWPSADIGATITVNGSNVSSGSYYSDTIYYGSRTYTIVVSRSGYSSTTYTLNVTR